MSAYLEALVYKAFLVKGTKHPPHALHEAGVHGFVTIVEVNPTSNTLHCLFPFLGVSAE